MACVARTRSQHFAAAKWIADSLYHNWSKELLEAGKKRLAGDNCACRHHDKVKVLRDARSERGRCRTGAGTVVLKSIIADGATTNDICPLGELEIIRIVERSHLSTPHATARHPARHFPLLV